MDDERVMEKLTFVSTRIPVSLKDKLVAIAKQKDKSLSLYIRRVLEKAATKEKERAVSQS